VDHIQALVDVTQLVAISCIVS